jgi:hypothetical protein
MINPQELYTNDRVKEVINQLIRELGRFPKIEEIAIILGTNKYQTQRLLKGLVREGFLVTAGNWYRVATKPSFHLVENSNEPTFPTSKGPIKEEEKEDLPIKVIRYSMGFVGIGAALLSLYFTFIWQSKLLPLPLAFLLSSIMVTFNVFAFEVIVLFISNIVTDKWWKWFVVVAFGVLWFMVAAFSISTTIARLYDENVAKLEDKSKKNINITAGSLKWNLIQEKKNSLNAQKKEKTDTVARYKALIPTAEELKVNPKKKKDFDTYSWLVNSLNREIAGLDNQLNEQRVKEEELIASNPHATDADKVTGKTPNFFVWLAKLLKIEPEKVQFMMTLFPALFVDLIAPAALAIALFLRRRKTV